MLKWTYFKPNVKKFKSEKLIYFYKWNIAASRWMDLNELEVFL